MVERSGVIIKVHAKPRSKRKELVFEGGLNVVACVKEPPAKGKANKAILKLLSKQLDIPSSNLEIIGGHASTTKMVRIEGLDETGYLNKAREATSKS